MTHTTSITLNPGNGLARHETRDIHRLHGRICAAATGHTQ